MFDLFDKSTFVNLDNWLKEVDQHAHSGIQVIVIANKYDLVEARKTQESSGEKTTEESIPER